MFHFFGNREEEDVEGCEDYCSAIRRVSLGLGERGEAGVDDCGVVVGEMEEGDTGSGENCWGPTSRYNLICNPVLYKLFRMPLYGQPVVSFILNIYLIPI